MAAPKTVPDADNATLRRMCAEGASWVQIADALGVSKQTAHSRAKFLRILGTRPAPPPLAPPVPDVSDVRQPLAAGHAVTWGAITAGTTLAGSAYAYLPPDTRKAAPAVSSHSVPLDVAA